MVTSLTFCPLAITFTTLVLAKSFLLKAYESHWGTFGLQGCRLLVGLTVGVVLGSIKTAFTHSDFVRMSAYACNGASRDCITRSMACAAIVAVSTGGGGGAASFRLESLMLRLLR